VAKKRHGKMLPIGDVAFFRHYQDMILEEPETVRVFDSSGRIVHTIEVPALVPLTSNVLRGLVWFINRPPEKGEKYRRVPRPKTRLPRKPR